MRQPTPRVLLHTSEPSSGAARYVADLALALHAAGERVAVFCPPNFAYLNEFSVAGVSIASSEVRPTQPGSLGARLRRNIQFLVSTTLRQVRLTTSHDLVHFHFPIYFPAGLLMFLLAKIQARAIVFTAHDPVPHKWLFPANLRFLEKRCLRLAYSWSDRIIVHNHAAVDLLSTEFGQPTLKITVIPHGASTRRCSSPPTVTAGPLRLLLFGSIRENKGIDLAIKAVQSLNAEEVQVCLCIAGSVANAREQEYWLLCKEQIARHDYGIVVLERFIPDEEAAALIADCDAVLIPYRDFESESGVAAQALSSGRAILASNIGSLAALLSSADLGIPITSVSAEGVKTAISTAMSLGRTGLQAKGQRGFEFVRDYRSWEAVARRTSALYAELLPNPLTRVQEATHG